MDSSVVVAWSSSTCGTQRALSSSGAAGSRALRNAPATVSASASTPSTGGGFTLSVPCQICTIPFAVTSEETPCVAPGMSESSSRFALMRPSTCPSLPSSAKNASNVPRVSSSQVSAKPAVGCAASDGARSVLPAAAATAEVAGAAGTGAAFASTSCVMMSPAAARWAETHASR